MNVSRRQKKKSAKKKEERSEKKKQVTQRERDRLDWIISRY